MKENQKNGRRMDGRETEEKIIECAGQLIAEKGFASVTSKEICRAAGVNLAAVNYHFGSRDGLYLAVGKRPAVPCRAAAADQPV